MDQEKINAFNEEQQRLKDEQAAQDTQASQAERIARSVTNSGSAVAGVISGTGARNEKATKEVGSTVSQVGHNIVEAVSQSQNEVAQALNNLVVATVVSKDPQLIQAAKDVAELLAAVAQAGSDFKGSKLNLLPVANERLAASIDKLASSVQEAPDKDYSSQLSDILTQLKKLDTKPVINVPKASVSVDLSPLLDAINQLKQTVQDTAVEIPADDDTDVVMGLQAVKQALDNLVFPVPNYVLPFKDSSGKATQPTLDTGGNVPVSGTLTVQPGNTPNTTPWLVTEAARSVSSQTALTTTATVSGAAGRFSGGSFINLNSVPSYIQVFDTTGAVTLGVTVPTFVQPIPANSTAANGLAYVFNIHPGIGITNGIKVAATTTATGASTSATALIGHIMYL